MPDVLGVCTGPEGENEGGGGGPQNDPSVPKSNQTRAAGTLSTLPIEKTGQSTNAVVQQFTDFYYSTLTVGKAWHTKILGLSAQ